VTKKKTEEKLVQTGKSTTAKGAAADREAVQASAEGPAKADVAKAQVARAMRERRRQPQVRPKAVPLESTAGAPEVPDAVGHAIAAIRGEIRSLKDVLEKFATPSTGTAGAGRVGATDTALEGTVDSLRRLLSELIEQRTESVVRDLVDVRREAANLSAGGHGGMVERLDHLLEALGAVRFEAEPMDVVDPLIHVVLEERRDTDAPDGVILEALRPGYRTGRGLVVCKAAVAVNRRS
jgi:hypothetical protein